MMTGMKARFNGEYAAHSINLHPPSRGTSEVKYPLRGRWTAFHTTVGVPKIEENGVDPSSPVTFEILADGKSLWKSEPVTRREQFQTVTLRVDKVKTLLLRASSKDFNGSARAFYLEPLLIE